jgi:hypothetical protein
MDSAPSEIDRARVICFTLIDERHHHTRNTRQIVDGVVQSAAAGLAICQYDGDCGFYLFGCDDNWNSVTDTWHQSLEDAQAQAVFEFEGVSDTWQFPTEVK